MSLGLAGLLGAGFFYYQGSRHHVSGAGLTTTSEADYLALKAENTLLKKMLGQIECEVVVMGSLGVEGKTSGKLVWDKTLQGGFLHVDHLPDAQATYSLWMGGAADKLVSCGVYTPDENGLIQAAFKAEQPVFKAHVFLLTKGRDTTAVVVKGLLP